MQFVFLIISSSGYFNVIPHFCLQVLSFHTVMIQECLSLASKLVTTVILQEVTYHLAVNKDTLCMVVQHSNA